MFEIPEASFLYSISILVRLVQIDPTRRLLPRTPRAIWAFSILSRNLVTVFRIPETHPLRANRGTIQREDDMHARTPEWLRYVRGQRFTWYLPGNSIHNRGMAEDRLTPSIIDYRTTHALGSNDNKKRDCNEVSSLTVISDFRPLLGVFFFFLRWR